MLDNQPLRFFHIKNSHIGLSGQEVILSLKNILFQNIY